MSAQRCCECSKPCRASKICHECAEFMCYECSRALRGVCTDCMVAERMDFEENSFITADDVFGREP